MIFARSDHPVNGDLVEKIALFCDVEPQAVVPMVTADHLYEIPLLLEEQGVADYTLNVWAWKRVRNRIGKIGKKLSRKPNAKNLNSR